MSSTAHKRARTQRRTPQPILIRDPNAWWQHPCGQSDLVHYGAEIQTGQAQLSWVRSPQIHQLQQETWMLFFFKTLPSGILEIPPSNRPPATWLSGTGSEILFPFTSYKILQKEPCSSRCPRSNLLTRRWKGAATCNGVCAMQHKPNRSSRWNETRFKKNRWSFSKYNHNVPVSIKIFLLVLSTITVFYNLLWEFEKAAM